MLIVKRRLQVACLWQYPPRRPANHQFYRVKNPMSSHRLSPLSAPVSGVLRFLSLLCLALPLLAASAWAASEPSVATIARAQPGPVTTGSSLKWRVTFTEAVTGVDPTDFALTLADAPDTSFPVTAGLITVTAGANAAEYFVTATGVAGVGTLRLDVT